MCDDGDFLAGIPDVALALEHADSLTDMPLAMPEASECAAAVSCQRRTTPRSPTPSSTASHHASEGENLFRNFTTCLGEGSAILAPPWPAHDQPNSLTGDNLLPDIGALTPHMTVDASLNASMDLVARLDARQSEGPHAVDEMLAMNREAACKINEQIDLEGLTLSSTSSILLTAAAEHIVSSSEITIRAKRYEQCKMPCVDFGSFRIDPEEQKALQTRIISKELRLNIDMIRRLAGAVTQRQRSVQDRLKRWLHELERRVETLIYMVENE